MGSERSRQVRAILLVALLAWPLAAFGGRSAATAWAFGVVCLALAAVRRPHFGDSVDRAIGALLALALSVSCGSSRPDDGAPSSGSTERRPLTPSAVVLITIDTLRADRVGAYGWQRARTPAIDGLAARGVRFDHAYAAAPITLPSHASLLTGLYPPQHGARHNGMRVAAGVPTLAELLQAHGFASWQLPDRVEIIDAVPKTSVGKFDKKALRARFAAR